MGWVWNDDVDDKEEENTNSGFEIRRHGDSNQCSTRKIVKSQCKTEEVEPGKFIRRCEKTEELLKDCVGRPSEVLQSIKEYTEEDATDQVVKGSFPLESSDVGPFGFPGLRGDIDAIERSLFGGMSRFFEAAEEMKNGFFSVFGDPRSYDGDSTSSPSSRRGKPIESDPPKAVPPKVNKPDGEADLSGLAQDV